MKFKRNWILTIAMILFWGTSQGQIYKSADSVGHKKSAWNVNIGSSIMGTSSGTYFMNTYIAPQFSYQQNEKWSYGGGAIISNLRTNAVSLYSSEQQNKTALSSNTSQTLLYAFGTYRPTQKITLNAMVYKSLNEDPNLKNQTNIFNNNMQGVMLHLNYQITEHTSFNIGFDYSDGRLNSPYNSRFGTMNNGFNSNPMQFGW